jgi:outer membrane protein assembly factor BamD
MKTVATLLCLTAALGLAGCKSLNIFSSDDNPTVTYGDDAESNIKKGDEALDGKNYVEAQKYFDYVKSKYPYLESAKTAELRLADTDFERERYSEARDRYQTFVKLHPTHPRNDYASFRAAMTFYKDMPSDLFILPPSAEKDQANLRSGLVAMKDFARSYPDSSHQEEAKKVLDDMKRRLADHELYVAAFYAKRDKWPAVITRLNVIARDYPDIGLDEKVYMGLYDAWKKTCAVGADCSEANEHAKDALRQLVQKSPNSDAGKKAALMLGPTG